jgi:hypothetical protein
MPPAVTLAMGSFLRRSINRTDAGVMLRIRAASLAVRSWSPKGILLSRVGDNGNEPNLLMASNASGMISYHVVSCTMHEVTAGDIVAYARSCRIRVNAQQISRWRRLGLLGPWRRPGRGRGRGRDRVLHTAGARRLTVFLARRLQRTRRLEDVGWAAWLQGYPVTPFARRILLQEVRRWARSAEVALDARARPNTSGGHLPGRVSEAQRNIELQAPLLSALFLGFGPSFDAFVKHEQAHRRTLPSDPSEYAPVLRKLQEPGRWFNAAALHRAIDQADDRTLECVRDTALIAITTVERMVSGGRNFFDGRLEKGPPLVLAVLALATLRRDDSAPTVGDFFRGMIRDFWITAARKPSEDPREAQVLALLRQVRKEMRCARRRAQIL